MPDRAEFLVVGSGAGGSVSALELARAGRDVLVLEEGQEHPLESYGQESARALRLLYRQGGMSPIVGSVPIGFAEGRCLGGSTEVNSGFWHRTPPEMLLRWKAQFDFDGGAESELEPHFAAAERALGVALSTGPRPPTTEVFGRGIRAMGWAYHEVPRAAPGCRNSNRCASGCRAGKKQGMTRGFIPEARRHGARFMTNTKALRLVHRSGRVTGVSVSHKRPDGTDESALIEADHVIVCGGPTQTPALLLRSGIARNVGRSLRIHPYLKVAAEFAVPVAAAEHALPLLQVREFWPDIALGGAYFSRGQVALTLSENWPDNRELMEASDRMAHYYVAVRGTGRGSVRPGFLRGESTNLSYELSSVDLRNLSSGLARLATLLLAGGARAVYPSVYGISRIVDERGAVRWLDETLPRRALSLVTVHAFSSCPAGERRDRCAVDSYGKVFGFSNLFVNDASMIPDSPGVNPQGTVMALAARNAQRLLASLPGGHS